tara:strand:+ start:1792 stop:2205 length:414 start_codon:yes stop_codon:yes gene_type:complete
MKLSALILFLILSFSAVGQTDFGKVDFKMKPTSLSNSAVTPLDYKNETSVQLPSIFTFNAVLDNRAADFFMMAPIKKVFERPEYIVEPLAIKNYGHPGDFTPSDQEVKNIVYKSAVRLTNPYYHFSAFPYGYTSYRN